MARDHEALRRWLQPLLLLSLMLNLVFIGMAVRTVYAYVKSDRPSCSAGASKRTLSQFIATLPAQRRSALDPVLDGERTVLKPLYEDLERARLVVLDAAAAEPIDQAKLDAALDRYAAAETKVIQGRVPKFGRVVSQLAPEERQAYRAWRLEGISERRACSGR